jgi:choline-sulfatase
MSTTLGRMRWREHISMTINSKMPPGWPLYLMSISTSVRSAAGRHVGLLAILVSLFHPSIALAQPTGRNILFIVADDMRTWVNYDDNFSGRYYTPNIDQLAAESTRYRTAYPTIPKCLGSRTSVMMGMSPPIHGLGYNRSFGYYDGGWPYLSIYEWSSSVSLPEALTGYYTAATGKVFHSPLPDKWDESGPTPIMTDYYTPWLPGPDNTYFYAEEITEEDDNPDQRIADWATNFVQTYSGEEPFFLAVGFNLPHQPL